MVEASASAQQFPPSPQHPQTMDSQPRPAMPLRARKHKETHALFAPLPSAHVGPATVGSGQARHAGAIAAHPFRRLARRSSPYTRHHHHHHHHTQYRPDCRGRCWWVREGRLGASAARVPQSAAASLSGSSPIPWARPAPAHRGVLQEEVDPVAHDDEGDAVLPPARALRASGGAAAADAALRRCAQSAGGKTETETKTERGRETEWETEWVWERVWGRLSPGKGDGRGNERSGARVGGTEGGTEEGTGVNRHGGLGGMNVGEGGRAQ